MHALDYYAFMEHLNGKECIKEVDPVHEVCGMKVATACGHAIHPLDGMTEGYCPVCEMRIYLTYLNAIVDAWEECGGPWKTGTLEDKKECHAFRGGWHMARLELEQMMACHVESADEEVEWERKHSDLALHAQDTNSASKAVRLAQEGCKYPAKLATPGTYPYHLRRENAQAKKKVSFSPDTNFRPRRQKSLYSRRSEYYEAGPHSCEPPEAVVDTSGCTQPLWNLRQMKVLTTTSQEEFDYWNDHSRRVPAGKEIAAFHPLWKDIRKFFASCIVRRDAEVRKGFEKMCEEADQMVLLIKNGAVEDVFLISSPHAEEEDSQETERVLRGGGWTSLKDCL